MLNKTEKGMVNNSFGIGGEKSKQSAASAIIH